MPALPPTQTLDKPSSTEHQQDLANKVFIDILTAMNITGLHRRINAVYRNINHGP